MQIKVKKTKIFSGECYSLVWKKKEPHMNMRRINAIKYLHTMPGKWTKEIGRSMQLQDAALQGLGLLYFQSLQGVGAITAEDKDLVVAEDFDGCWQLVISDLFDICGRSNG